MDSEAITVMSLDCQYKLTLGEYLDKWGERKYLMSRYDRKRGAVYRPKDKTLHLSPVSICGII